MSRYQAYPEYKDFGVDFLDELPTGWDVQRGKYVFSEFSERSTTGEELLLSVSEYFGVKPRGEVIEEGDHLSRAESLVDYKKCSVNDLVMNIMLAWKCGLGVTKYDGIVSPAYSVFRFGSRAYPDFMHYLLRTSTYTGFFKTRSTGVIDSRLRLYPESFGNVPIVIPPRNEQISIANFLDHETAKIDTLIEKQQQLIQLLKEKRQAVISHAVTKGLNPNAPMKDSGVEWLGEVPEGWEVMQVRRILPFMEQGKSPECESRPAEDNEWGVLKTSCVNHAEYRSEENKFLPVDIAPFPQYEVKVGDVLMSRASGSVDLIGSVAYVFETRPKILLSDKIFRLGLSKSINGIFFKYLMQSSYMRTNIKVAISGAEGMANNITKGSVMSFNFALPDLNEQSDIVKYLDKETALFAALLDKAERMVSLLYERRTALISAAVTGKIDVRAWQSPIVKTQEVAL